MNKTNLDSLVSYVRILSGEDSIAINDSIVIVTPRGSFFGNYLAADYIKNKLKSFRLETYDHHFYQAEDPPYIVYPVIGRNIYSVQRGKTFPDKYFIYCAHWDAVTDYCADDNASGVAGVLEAARILSKYQFEYSIMYVFFDCEELGLKGSHFFAAWCDSNKLDIEGVLNLDMAGWDSDGDGLIDIHTQEKANSVFLSNAMYIIDSLYNLPLKPIIYNPGSIFSDHCGFWDYNYSAVCFSEAFGGGDYNPYFESKEDRIDKFNLEYYHNICKLGIASLSTLATENFVSSADEYVPIPYIFNLCNYPNPFNPNTTIIYSISKRSNVVIKVYDMLGKEITTLVNEEKPAGNYEVEFDGSKLSSGVYFYQLRTGSYVETKRMVLSK